MIANDTRGSYPMIDKSWYRRPLGVSEHTNAGGVVVRRSGERLDVALIREGRLAGYVLPKGHVKPDEPLERAARREIAEEAGLIGLRFVGELAVRERLDYAKQSWGTTHYFLYVAPELAHVPADPADRRALVHWFPLETLPAMLWPEQRELLETNRDRIMALLRSADRGPS